AGDPHEGQNLERKRTDVKYQSHYSNKDESNYIEKSNGPLSGKSSTDKIKTHYELKKEAQLARAHDDESEWATFSEDEKDIDELVSEAKVTSVLKQGNQDYSCYLDDYF